MIVQCCQCKKVRRGSAWREAPAQLDYTHVSHGYCPACAEALIAELRAAGIDAAPHPSVAAAYRRAI